MSLLAYDDPNDTDEFGMKRASVISNGSIPAVDPAVAAEVTELRAALAAAQEATNTAEARVHVLEAELTRFKEQHAFVSASKEAAEQKLREETVRREVAEEKVELLRGQVEQARRSVMALQKQEQDRAAASRAASGASAALADTEEPSNTTKKRQSLYGRGRPMSTVSVASESGDTNATPPPAAPATGLRELRLGSNHARQQSLALRLQTDTQAASLKSPRLPKSPRSPSGAMSPGTARPGLAPEAFDNADGSPPLAGSLGASTASGPSRDSRAASFDTPAAMAPNSELLATQAEVASLRQQLEALAIQYAESEEARIASETCVKALRDFIAADPSPGTGMNETISLPPLPTDKAADDLDEGSHGQGQNQQGPARQATWGFGGLFGKAAAPAPAPAPAPSSSAASVAPSLASVLGSPKIAVTPPEISPRNSIVASPPSHPAKVDEDAVIAPATAAGLGRSFTSFFGRRRQSKASTTTAAAAAAVAETQTQPQRTSTEAVNAAALGLQLEDLAITLPPPPSAPDVEYTAPTPRAATSDVQLDKDADALPATEPLNPRTPSPRPARSPARSSARAISPIAEADTPASPKAPESPPAASVTTNEDSLATPADSPVPEEFEVKDDKEDDKEEEEDKEDKEDAEATPQKAPARPARGEARRGRARGRGRRGAA